MPAIDSPVPWDPGGDGQPMKIQDSPLGRGQGNPASARIRMARVLATGFAAVSTAASADNPAAVIVVDANANRRAISPLVYGANWADQAMIGDLNLSVNRRGGNATTTYNWQANAANRAGDWYFESLGDGEGDLSLPSVGADAFTTATLAGGAAPMMTIPMVDWVAKLGPNRQGLAAYSVAKYGAQTATDPWWPDAGNGVRASDGSLIVSDPNDAYTPNSPAFQKLWVQHLVNKFGTSANGGIKFYLTDNEHGVWPWNHRPIVPVGPTMDSIRDRIIAYGGAVKEVDPAARIVGPEEWGWPNYFNSPYDTQFPGGNDRAAHGGWDYMPWLLKELKAHEDQTGRRLLDVFSLHYYPQYGEFGQGDSSVAAQLKRNECTRDLWDPGYHSTSWIWNTVKLIPRMKEWVNAHYPGTGIAITEYSWGAEGHISGAIAQADVLGIFGREGVDLATFWGSLDGNLPVRNAFKIYRNYDGLKGTFGDTSVSAGVANPDHVSAFAAQRDGDGALTVMVICKHLADSTPVTVNLANFAAGSAAQVWQFTSANTIDRLADATVAGDSLSFSAPAQSVTLFVIPGSGVVPDSLKARYALEGDAQDSSGSGNHGTATALAYVTGKVGAQAAQFDGTSSRVSIPRAVTDDFTAALWVKTTDYGGWPGAQWWSGKGLVDGEVGGGGADWGTALVDGKFVLGVGSAGGDTTIASSVNINDGAWHHVAATRDNTTGAMAVYVDGVLRGSGTGPTGSRNWPAGLRIGCLQTGNNFLHGTLDDVRLYDRVLTGSEIAAFVNTPPVLESISDSTVNVGQTVAFTASGSDNDLPAQTMSYTLLTGPANATLDSNSGAFSFRPLVTQANTTIPFTLQVSDSGVPPLTATRSFSVTVNPLVMPTLGNVTFADGQLSLRVNGQNGPDYRVETSTNLTQWTPAHTATSPAMPFTWTDTDTDEEPRRFYRVTIGPPFGGE
jgi:hypothetical protein